MINDIKYKTTISQNGAKWEIYTQESDEGYIAVGPIADFINSAEGDPRYD